MGKLPRIWGVNSLIPSICDFRSPKAYFQEDLVKVGWGVENRIRCVGTYQEQYLYVNALHI